MTIDDLFMRWQMEYSFQAFIKDGIVEDSSYEHPRILFVLRDMNCNTDCDLRECLRTTGSGWNTRSNIGRWTAALLDGTNDYPKDMSRDRRISQLKRVAVLNLKKEGGSQRANVKKRATPAR